MPLSDLRKQIDKLDHDIVKLLHKRKKIVEKVAKVKMKKGMEIFDRKRENDIAQKLNGFVKKYDLNKAYLYKLWDTIMLEAKEVQKKILK